MPEPGMPPTAQRGRQRFPQGVPPRAGGGHGKGPGRGCAAGPAFLTPVRTVFHGDRWVELAAMCGAHPHGAVAAGGCSQQIRPPATPRHARREGTTSATWGISRDASSELATCIPRVIETPDKLTPIKRADSRQGKAGESS